MMTKQTVLQLAEKHQEPEWLVQKRLHAYQQFTSLPLPSFQYGLGMFLDSSRLSFDALDPLGAQDETIITADPAVEVMPLPEALQKYPQLMKNSLMSCMKIEDKVMALHAAYSTSCLVIRVPRGVRVEQPVMIHLRSTTATSLRHVLVIAEPESNVTIVHMATPRQEGFASCVVEILAREHALVKYVDLTRHAPRSKSFAARYARVERDGMVQWIDCFLQSGFMKSTFVTSLEGEGASTTTHSLFMGDREQQMDIDIRVLHVTSHTTSRLVTHGVLGGKAKAVCRGLIKIQPSAVGCDGFQQQHTLLLSEDAEVDPVPMLEIHHDDVTCSHATTVSDIDDEKLFYLMSRGLDEASARRSIVEGFATRILHEIPEAAHTLVKPLIEQRLQEL